MAEYPLMLKQKVGMMLREQLWSPLRNSLQECTWMLRIAVVGHGFPGLMWSWEHALLLNYYSLGQPELSAE